MIQQHFFIHHFKSRNVAAVRLTLPRRGHPVRYLVRWTRAPEEHDLAEYPIWRAHILAELEQRVGKQFRMTDAAEERLAAA